MTESSSEKFQIYIKRMESGEYNITRMGYFTKKTEWQNWEFGILKGAVLSIGILAGIYFEDYLENYLVLFWLIAIGGSLWTSYIWIKRMKKS